MIIIDMQNKSLCVFAPSRVIRFSQRRKDAKGKSNAGIIWFFLTAFILLINVSFSSAQEISAEATAKLKDYLVGDRILVTLIVKRPDNFFVKWVRQNPDPAALELVDSIAVDSAKENGFEKIDYLLPLAGFDSGTAVYPAQLFIFHKHGDTASFIIKTKPISFHVSSITVDLKKDIKPIVDPLEPGIDWRIVLLYIIAGLIVVAMIIVGYLIWRPYSKAKKKTLSLQPEIIRPFWEIAIENLARLQKEDLPGRGEVKEYYSSLSNIIRQFVSEQYNLDALELTTEELAEVLNRKSIKTEATQLLFKILQLSDSVKFAKYNPEVADHEKAMSDSYEFIDLFRSL